ncbi:glutamine synthetase family protein [Agromyces mangrovi Wang et al. 2018]|uniref:glutamine synthetase family protein n=1 Tax=Agromyces mangrovi TaxID=1858653 RepID=UPI002572A6C4|nr:glutamine synthetase family protein [Agromyces mangrovi]BDZ64141.1 glutamine synthetase [Agromyces mangrovi]
MSAPIGTEGVHALLVTHVDNAGVSRVKVLPGRRIDTAGESGVSISNSVGMLFSVDDHLNSTPEIDAIVGDLRGIPDVSALAMLDAETGLAWAPADLRALDGSEHPTCQRSALKRVVSAAEDDGLAFRIGFELEFTVFRDPGEAGDAALDVPEYANDGPAYSTRAFLDLEPWLLATMAALDAAGVPVEQVHPEFGDGQVEIALAPREPLRAVDELVLARIVILRTAAQHGLLVSFAPVPIAGGPSSGCHVHLSAAHEGRALCFDAAAPHGFTPEAGMMIAGILDRLEEGLALHGGSVLSFDRLQPNHWAGAYRCWGPANREAAIRVVEGQAGREPAQANLEFKCTDAAANPYLSVAALLASALDGIARRAEPPEPVLVDPSSLSDEERDERGIARLPADLGAALDLLKGSTFFHDVFGTTLLDAYVASRRHEWEAYGGLDTAAVAEIVRWRY